MLSRSLGLGLSSVISAFLTISILLLSAAGVPATEYFWNSPNGGSGTWDTATANWYPDALGTPPPVIWNNGTVGGDDATFYGTAVYTVTVASGGINVHNITNNTTIANNPPGYTISGGTITLVGTTPTITANGTTAIRSVIAGTNGFVKAGPQFLDLFGDNTYSGVTDVQAGWIDPQTDTAFGTSSVIIEDGATVWSWGDSNVSPIRTLANAITLSGAGMAGNGALQACGTNGAANCRVTLNGAITLAASATMGASANTGQGTQGSFTVNNTITGTDVTLTFNSASSENSIFNGAISSQRVN